MKTSSNHSDYLKIIHEIIESIEKKQRNHQPVIMAIEGQCGAGKTSLAKHLKEYLDVAVIKMDDFFLPMELRSQERYEEAGGNVHYERFKEEVVENLMNALPVIHQVFDCSVMSYNAIKKIPAKSVIIVEGSYSAHPFFGSYYDLLIYMTVSPELQLERIKARVGKERMTMFVEKWIPFEEKYAADHQIKKKADMVIDASSL